MYSKAITHTLLYTSTNDSNGHMQDKIQHVSSSINSYSEQIILYKRPHNRLDCTRDKGDLNIVVQFNKRQCLCEWIEIRRNDAVPIIVCV